MCVVDLEELNLEQLYNWQNTQLCIMGGPSRGSNFEATDDGAQRSGKARLAVVTL